MNKTQTREKAVSFLNVGLTKELDDRLNAYCVERNYRNGKLRHGLRTKIARQALREWLDKHEKDFEVEL